MMARRTDVLILGAGPAGASLALALKRAGVGAVGMIDASVPRPLRIGEAAAPGLGALLARLGLDDGLEAQGHRSCHGNRSLWGGDAHHISDFMVRAQGPGWHLDRSAFDAWLLDKAQGAGAELFSPARLEAAEWEGDRWRAGLRYRDRTLLLQARWIVDATGRPAAFARRNGATLHRLDRLIALAVRAEPAEEPGFDSYSQIEASETGWWYAAQLPGGKTMVSLMTDNDLARSCGLFSAEGFAAAWRATREISRLAEPVINAPAVFPAGTQFIDQAIAPGWLALGDALMAFDPLSASGITGAIEDAITAGELLVHLLDEPDERESASLRHAYAARANAGLSRFMAEHRAIYAAETRWPKSPFWQRRSAAYTARPASIPS
jgi:flavin-dependent dehydrogenase